MNEINGRTDSLLEQLRKKLPVAKSPHPWQEMADLMRENDGIIDVTESGFSVLQDHGRRVFEEPRGLTEEHYTFFAPYLVGNDLDKALLAEAVLKKMVKQEGCPEPETGLWLLRKKYDHDEDGFDQEYWLPEFVEAKAFSVIAREMAQAVEDYRKTTPRVIIGKKTLPSWDAALGELRVGDVLIKKFTKPAKNQRLVLTAFQGLDWRHRMDDPLKPWPRRRAETVAGLNDGHINQGIIHFRCDGTGEGFIWEWCK